MGNQLLRLGHGFNSYVTRGYAHYDNFISFCFGTDPEVFRFFVDDHLVIFHGEHDAMISCGCLKPSSRCMLHKKMKYGYGSIPINTIFSGMNIHKSQLFWCEQKGYKVLTHCHMWNPSGQCFFLVVPYVQRFKTILDVEAARHLWNSDVQRFIEASKNGTIPAEFVTTSIMVYEKKGGYSSNSHFI